MGMVADYNLDETIENIEDTIEYISLKVEVEKAKEQARHEEQQRMRIITAAKQNTYKWLMDI